MSDDDPSEIATGPMADVAPRAVGGDTVLDALEMRCPACGRPFPRAIESCPFDGGELVEARAGGRDPLVGLTIRDRYVVERRIGEGGMGAVYEARHIALGKSFALKILRPELALEPTAVERFVREARVAASLKHPNLAGVSDLGEIDGDEARALGVLRLPFFAMELLVGRTLADLMREEGALDPKVAKEIFRQAAAGLGAAHAAGVVHRDLKPDNVFLVDASGRIEVKVLDFGIAKLSAAPKLTRPNVVFGTPSYMSPEQARGGPLDARSDVYGLGVVMYEALSGRVPFEADTEMGVMTKLQFERAEPIERVLPPGVVAGELGAIVMRCLEKDAAMRYANATELAAALEGREIAEGRPADPLELRGAGGDDVRAAAGSAPGARVPWRAPALVFALGSVVVVLAVLLVKRERARAAYERTAMSVETVSPTVAAAGSTGASTTFRTAPAEDASETHASASSPAPPGGASAAPVASPHISTPRTSSPMRNTW